jgi:UDP-GlcNAc:undecaprenyl-phosphate/decaprenyl-phosphate GlcNAc-1-phosphate transferase
MNHSQTSTAENRPVALGQAESTPSPWWVSAVALSLAAGLLLPALRAVWQGAGGRWVYILIVSSLIAYGLTPLVIRLAHAFDILDVPASRKVHSAPTPLLGGLAIYAAFATAILANSILDRQVSAILIGGSLLVIVGILDDILDVPAIVKLVTQLVAAAIVIGSGVAITLFPRFWFGNFVDAILTIIWLLGITNAMNFFDGMDGLATGLSIVCAGFLGLFAYLSFQPFLGWFAAAVAGSCLGFLPFNFRRKGPALVFLGDAGSTFLGFTLAALAVKGDWAENNIIDIGAPILIFWVFIYDMTYITVARILTGKVRSLRDWIAYVGRDHLHHRLASLLGSKRQAVFLVFLFAICTGLAAIALVHASTMEAVILILQAVVIVVIFSILEHAGNQ